MKFAFSSLHLSRTLTGAVAGVSGRLTARAVRLLLRLAGELPKALALSTLLGLAAGALAATPPNRPISNTVGASYSIDAHNYTASASATVTTAACIDVGLKIELLQYLPPASIAFAPAGSRTETVQPTGYAPNGEVTGPFTPLGNPTLLGNPTPTTLPSSLFLAPLNDVAGKTISAYARNEPIFIRVVSYDANTTPGADRVAVTLTTSSGDREVLQLTETAPSSGIFVGAAASVRAPLGSAPTANDGKLTNTTFNETISAVYSHPNCASGDDVTSISRALIDPSGTVFDARTGAPVNGTTISLIDTLTNLPAPVFCDDGVTILPQPITSGSPTICDGGITMTSQPANSALPAASKAATAVVVAGTFRFPQVAAGNYRLVVIPPPGYLFPSAVTPASLPALIGTPPVTPVILGTPGQSPGGSYGGVFSLTGPAVKVDIPVDVGSTALTIQKAAGKAVAGTGEFVPYTLTITNNSASVPTAMALIADHPPPGFRYQKGSTRLNGQVAADPQVAPDARTLIFTINLATTPVTTLRYVLEVTPGARPGIAENTAAATGGLTSNTAHASVLVREDLYRNKAILIGRVIDGSCDDQVNNDAKGLANARVVLQDGTYVLTDREGRWHIDNLRAGTQVVQLDLDSLPEDYEVVGCEENSRFAGRSYSQFVNLRGGTMWRADFHVQKKTVSASAAREVLPETAATGPVKPAVADDPTRLVERLPYDEAWLSSAQPGNEWLHPQESFHPNLPVLKMAVKHDPRQKPVLTVNGEAVNPLLFDGTQTNAGHGVALSTWNGVPVKEGDNRLELVISDARGQEVSRTVRNIHYAATPDRLELVPQQSRLLADGKSRPLIAVRFLDKDGVPVRRGISGEFQLNEPYRSYDRREALDRNPLTGQLGGKPRFEIKSDGLAMIELEPTTQSGEAVLTFQFNDQRTQEVRAWLQAGQRDWILVGFAEGTAGHQTLSGNLQALQAADSEEQLFDDNQLAFYAKGLIRGDYLLTVAYDTAKETGDKQLKQAVDPSRYYTLYADATQAGYDAASASRLYVKLERQQFYAMFGDYDTGLSVTELSRYSRTMTGVKSEYKGEQVGYNAFASLTSQAYVKDEIPGNGTSGVYKLSRTNLMINSDKIRLETRDRFQSQVIVSTQYLTRYLDYDIDYHLGTLTFHEPIATRDSNFNPTYIICEYESADPADEKATYGGRGSFKPSPETEIGATLVHEGTVGATGNLQGLDATYQLDANTKLRAEVATTSRDLVSGSTSGNAWLGELQHREELWDAKVYAREQADGFGLGQQASSETGTRKIGADGRLKLSETLQLRGQAYQQEYLPTDANNRVLEGRADQKLSEDLSAYYGARTSQDQSGIGKAKSDQLLAGAAYSLLDRKLTLRGGAEVGSSTAGSVSMPNRLLLGTDYKVTEQTKVFAEQEFASGEKISANTTRAGLRTRPWSGGEVSSSVGNSTYNDAERLYANLGLVQRWQVNEQWQTDFSLDRSQTLRNTAVAINPNTPLPSGSTTGDYTATTLGATYHTQIWSGNGRIEIRKADTDQLNLQFGMQRQLGGGRAMAAGLSLREADAATGSTRNSDLRLSYAHRPNDSRWVWFDRVDYITQSSQAAASTLKGTKLVNNLNANYMPNRRTQIALQYGAKYVLDTIDATDYSGYTDLFGTEIRYDLTKKWDIGAFGSVMRSVNSGVRDYAMGASLGYKVMENIWLSVGYNVRGLDDRDFTAAEYRNGGMYLTMRMKVDQDTFGLNKNSKVITPTTIEQER